MSSVFFTFFLHAWRWAKVCWVAVRSAALYSRPLGARWHCPLAAEPSKPVDGPRWAPARQQPHAGRIMRMGKARGNAARQCRAIPIAARCRRVAPSCRAPCFVARRLTAYKGPLGDRTALAPARPRPPGHRRVRGRSDPIAVPA